MKSPINLHWAAANGKHEIVTLLLEKGEDINAQNRDYYHYTPLHCAAEAGHNETVKLLLEKGADVNARDARNDTPLHKAAGRGRNDIVELLIEQGADINVINDYFGTPLYMAAMHARHNTVKFLLDKGADINAARRGNTPLHNAVENNYIESVRHFLEKGAHVNIQDDFKRIPLHLAIENNNLEIAKLLLEKGSNIDIQDHLGYTSLEAAAYLGTCDDVLLRSIIRHAFETKVDLSRYKDTYFNDILEEEEEIANGIIQCTTMEKYAPRDNDNDFENYLQWLPREIIFSFTKFPFLGNDRFASAKIPDLYLAGQNCPLVRNVFDEPEAETKEAQIKNRRRCTIL